MPDYFYLACQEASRGMQAGDGGPFGAIVVKDGKVIGKGHNRVLSAYDSTAHAEICAIREAEQFLQTYTLTGCQLYTTCYPCPMCLGAIMWARITTVYYGCTAEEAAGIGFDDQAFYQAFKSPDTNQFVTLKRDDNPGCRRLFKQWLEMDNRVIY